MSAGTGNIQIEFRDTSSTQYDANGVEIKLPQENGRGKLYIGDRHCGSFLQLKHRKCRTLICCSAELSSSCLENDIKYLKIDPMVDEKESLWDSAYKIIDSEVSNSRNVVLQCETGTGKSAAVAMYYAMKKQSISLEKSYKLVESCHRETKLRPRLLERLIAAEKALRGCSSMYLEDGKKVRFGSSRRETPGTDKNEDKMLNFVIKMVIYGGIVLLAYAVYVEVDKARI